MAMGKANNWAEAGIEPKLDDMIADPLVRVVMRHGGVTDAELRGMLEALRGHQSDRSESFG